jgi:hypothetical protein
MVASDALDIADHGEVCSTCDKRTVRSSSHKLPELSTPPGPRISISILTPIPYGISHPIPRQTSYPNPIICKPIALRAQLALFSPFNT